MDKAYDSMNAAIVVGTPTAGAFPVAIQLSGPSSKDLVVCGGIFAYLSKSADGSDIAVHATDTNGFAIDTDGLQVPVVANIASYLISESDGDIDLTITILTTKTAYLVVVLPNGKLVISSIMTYTA